MTVEGLKPALFLDRDGVLIKDVPYLHDPDKVVLMEGVVEIIQHAQRAGWAVVVATNQSGIARGLFTESDCIRMHQHIDHLLAALAVKVDCWYYCPYHPTKGIGSYLKESDWRKPHPGMFFQAAKDLQLDLDRSIMIGDKLSDVIEHQGIKSYLIQGDYSLGGGDKKIIFADLRLLLQYIIIHHWS
ncbi:MAG: HAD family hydrolase [Oligoflexia bacterium]|nr:HAD family hydrolase [Oligoflexia bacterium]MBF0366054.1 HAD family hydrolase [Oligoflexia bacterium]